MEKDTGKLQVEFNNAAAKIYFHLTEKFSASVKPINRYSNENVFKLQEAKYLSMLKQMLEDIARITLEKSESDEIREKLKAFLTSRINYFMQEFRLRSDSM